MKSVRFFYLVLFLCGLALTSAHAETVRLKGISYPEGALWQGQRLYFTEMGRDRVAYWDGTTTKVFWEQEGCGPTAIAPFGKTDFLILCHLGAELVVTDKDGRTLQTYDRDDAGERLRDPNDATSDGAGGAFFSDAGEFRKSAASTGDVVHISADGHVKRLARKLHYANGVYFDTHTRRLFVSEHLARRVLVFDAAPNFSLGARRIVFDLDRDGTATTRNYAESGPDGLEIDQDGVLWICEYGQGRLHAFDLTKGYLGVVAGLPRFTDTVGFAPDGRAAFGGAYSNDTPGLMGEIRVMPLETLKSLLKPKKAGPGENGRAQ